MGLKALATRATRSVAFAEPRQIGAAQSRVDCSRDAHKPAKSVRGKTANGFPFVVGASALTTATHGDTVPFEGSRVASPRQELDQIEASISNPLSNRPFPLAEVLGDGPSTRAFPPASAEEQMIGNFMLQVPTANSTEKTTRRRS